MTVDFTSADVEAWALLVYGQNDDPTSPQFDAQTLAFSEKEWRRVAFRQVDIEADPVLITYTVVGR